MASITKRGLLLLAALSIVALSAAPAQASITTDGRGGFRDPVTGTDSTTSLTSGGLVITCGRSTAVVNLSSGTQGSGSVDYVSGTGRTCFENVLGSSCRVTVSGRVTLRSTASVAGTSASFDVTLDRDFRVFIDCLRDVTVPGDQALGSCATFSQAGQTLTFNCNVADSTTGGARTATFRGVYRNTGRTVTVS